MHTFVRLDIIVDILGIQCRFYESQTILSKKYKFIEKKLRILNKYDLFYIKYF